MYVYVIQPIKFNFKLESMYKAVLHIHSTLIKKMMGAVQRMQIVPMNNYRQIIYLVTPII